MDQEYFKDFDGWNRKKKKINKAVHLREFSEKEIWWASLGVNIGREIDGKHHNYERPVLIIKKLSTDTLWAIPLTSTNKEGSYFYGLVIKDMLRTLSLLQLRMISSNRLLRKIEKISDAEFFSICRKTRSIIPKKRSPRFFRGVSIAFRQHVNIIQLVKKYAILIFSRFCSIKHPP